MRTSYRRLPLVAFIACALVATASVLAAPKASYGDIDLLRDPWGIPHVFSSTDSGAIYGLGYATAEERGFQMTYSLRIIQGRLAEIAGDRPKTSGRETALQSDRKMRTFGWARAATRTSQNLDPETRQLLEAYCEGVNDGFSAQEKAGRLHPLFQRLGFKPEPWTPADCLLSWWHVAQFFAGDGTRDLMVWRNRVNPRYGQPQPPQAGRTWFDDSTAVVQRSAVSDGWARRVEEFVSVHGLVPTPTDVDPPKFSHAWVVGSGKNDSGAAVLVSDPQTPVRNPSLWMEFHVSGKTLHARGVGVPGSPGLLIGFTPHTAWGLTALGADQADLFRLETSPDHPDQYKWDGKWRPMETRTETIQVKDGAPETLLVRETHLGPIASAFCYRQPGDPDVALKRIPICETDRETIQSLFAMMRARNAGELSHALAGWRFPSANCVYGDSRGHAGFAVVGAIPVRSRAAGDINGNECFLGDGSSADWQGYVPHALLPQIMDPKDGFILSANHRPIGAFYKIPLGISTGSMGDTIRSWRLRERLSAQPQFSPADVRDIHFDTVNPARREIVRLGIHLRDTDPDRLSESGSKAVQALEKWLRAGASSDLRADGAELATRISTFFRFVATPLALKYGGGESGLARFLKDASGRITADPKIKLVEEEVVFIDKVLSDAWGGDDAGRGATRSAGARRAPAQSQPLGWFDTLDGFGSLDSKEDIVPMGITCRDGQTIRSQAAQSYTQWVPLHDVDSSQSICPIGHSDRPNSRYRSSTLNLWQDGRFHPAPLSRAAVEKLGTDTVRLN